MYETETPKNMTLAAARNVQHTPNKEKTIATISIPLSPAKSVGAKPG
jgi:hypothetical protein